MKFFLFFAFSIMVNLSLYSQCQKGDCKNGKGEYIFQSGARYVGEFKNNMVNGAGTLYFANGDTYTGAWINNIREGKGKMTFKNGEIYDGNFKQNRFDGLGVYSYKDGSKYTGYWKDNKRNGEGILVKPNGQKVSGDWEEDELGEEGNVAFQDNKNNQPAESASSSATALKDCNLEPCMTGKGKFTYNDGSRYEGTFLNGKPEGSGTVYYSNGDVYTGGWENHAPNGEGTITYSGGRVIRAMWKNGKAIQRLEIPNTNVATNLPKNEPVQSAKQQPLNTDKVRIWAVIIGVSGYENLPLLKYSDDDAWQMYSFLKSPEGGALPEDQIKILIDESATRSNILKLMKDVFSMAGPNDEVLLYFSGHGLNGSFLPIDSDGYKNRISYDDIKEILNESKAKHKVCIADACYSGSLLASKSGYSESMELFYQTLENSLGGTAFLLSSKQQETSLESGGLRQGIFSHFLLRGLKGEADADQNHIISLNELYEYVYKSVKAYTNNAQTPILAGNYDKNMPVGVTRSR